MEKRKGQVEQFDNYNVREDYLQSFSHANERGVIQGTKGYEF